jgi:hypothetical protein
MSKIEFFEEEDESTLLIDDEHFDVTIDLYPDSKTYNSQMSLKNDVYYRTQKYEYRIKIDPIRVESRLVERVDEPPERYCVKDGVVLESEILKERGDFIPSMTKEFINDLKKEVEWNEDLVGNPISMYILSKHTDVLPSNDYKHYLQELSERIKIGIQKVEKAIEKDPFGLRVTDEYEGSGCAIWLLKSEQDKRSDDEIKKIVQHQQKIQEQLFDEKSKDYVGISESEFRSSKDILENVDLFLNKKPNLKKKKENEGTSFFAKVSIFVIQWIFLFIFISIVIGLLSLVIAIIEYSFIFALFVSGVWSLLIALRMK